MSKLDSDLRTLMVTIFSLGLSISLYRLFSSQSAIRGASLSSFIKILGAYFLLIFLLVLCFILVLWLYNHGPNSHKKKAIIATFISLYFFFGPLVMYNLIVYIFPENLTIPCDNVLILSIIYATAIPIILFVATEKKL